MSQFGPLRQFGHTSFIDGHPAMAKDFPVHCIYQLSSVTYVVRPKRPPGL